MAYLEAAGLSDIPFVLVPGGLHFRKNAELILEAWPLLKSLHPELTLAIVNHSNAVYVERAKALGEAVKMLGFVSEDGLHALYSAARVVWFPSRSEGFGLPVVEAMACGAPVVASRASSLPEIAGNAALFAAASDVGQHVDAVSSLWQDNRLRQTLSAQGRERAAQFTWSKSAGQLKTCLDALL
jgi:glycosyltransferase involved in cell wall biosynthesis